MRKLLRKPVPVKHLPLLHAKHRETARPHYFLKFPLLWWRRVSSRHCKERIETISMMHRVTRCRKKRQRESDHWIIITRRFIHQ